MKINIFGIGRSGTKAVQLYLAYALAKQNRKVQINYEPYLFIRKNGPINFRGVYFNQNEDMFISDIKHMTKKHINYISTLNNSNLPIINKFIHANGRITPINQITNPDLTIILIRDLYSIINSIAQTKWDFLNFGYFLLKNTYRDGWSKLISEITKKDLIQDKTIISNIHDAFHKTALYWYVMNLKALQTKGKNVVFLNYNNLNQISNIVKDKLNIECSEKISDIKFIGTNIHKEFPLESLEQSFFSKKNIYQQKLNEYNYYLFSGKRPPLFNFKIGTVCKINNAGNISNEYEEKYRLKIHFEKTELLDSFNNEIMNTLAKKEFRI